MENQNKQTILLPFISLTCAIFTALLFLANIFYHLALEQSALDLIGTVILLAISSTIGFLITICLFYGKKTGFVHKIFPVFFTVILFTFTVFVIFIFYYILLSNNMTQQKLWNIPLLLFLLGFSTLESILSKLIKFGNYLVRTLIHFLSIGIFYFILTLAIFKIGNGAGLIFVIFAYILTFSVFSVAYYFIISHKKRLENEELKYKKQF